MVYTEDLKSSAARLVGSSPTPGTNKIPLGILFIDFYPYSDILTHTFAPVAQSVEQLPLKQTVVGSIPTEGTSQKVY